MADKFRVRLATSDNAQDIHDCVTALASFEREPDAVKVTVADYRAFLSQSPPPFQVLLAETHDGSEVAGMALFFNTFSTWEGVSIYLEDLFVHEKFRGAGVGTLLLASLAELAREKGYKRVDWCCLSWNEKALNFYKSLGAEVLEDWRMIRLSGDNIANLSNRK